MRGRKTRPKVKPPCRKKGKKVYAFGESQRLVIDKGWRFYRCPGCRGYHRTTHEPGIAGVAKRKKE